MTRETRAMTALAIIAAVLLALIVVAGLPAHSQTVTDTGGSASCTTNVNGYCTVPHGLGTTPGEVQLTGRAPIGGAYTLGQLIADSPTDTTFRLRAIAASGTPIANQTITFWWHVWASPAAPTTTVAPATTAAPTTTSPPSCFPITITVGGTYSGCYQSTSAGTPAVTLATSQPVTLSHAHVIAKGYGVQDTVTGTQLSVLDTVFDQTDPGAVVGHRAVELEHPASFDFEHNQLNDGDGVWIGSGPATVNPFVVRDNLAFNIGRYPHPTTGNCCVQFLQLDHITLPAGVIAYNHVQNTSGQSGVEDNINLYWSGGSDSAHKVDLHHNLVDGAYPLTPSNTQFTGGGILGADGSNVTTFGHVTMHDNTVVSTTNYGLACAGGTDCHASNNVTVNDRQGSDGSTFYNSDFGQAYSMHDTTSSDVTSGSYNWLRNATDGQQPCWMGSFCSGLVQVATTEQQARDNWAVAVPAGELPIGPRT